VLDRGIIGCPLYLPHRQTLGLVYGEDDARRVDKEMAVDFRDLIGLIEDVLKE